MEVAVSAMQLFIQDFCGYAFRKCHSRQGHEIFLHMENNCGIVPFGGIIVPF